MPVLIVGSKSDPAATNIAERLVANFGFKYRTENGKKTVFEKGNLLLLQVDGDVLDMRNADLSYHAEAIVCISRHSSGSGRPTLTTHVPGNTGRSNRFGGFPRALAWADPQRLQSALNALLESTNQLGLREYSVSLEATHHGPTELHAPVLFVEIGSTSQQWISAKAAEAAAEAALKAATERGVGKSAVGFGGGHYSPKHTATVSEGGFAIGHILPNYFFQEYDPYVVDQAFRKTLGGCDTAVIDWKGLKSQVRKKLVSTLEKMNISLVKV